MGYRVLKRWIRPPEKGMCPTFLQEDTQFTQTTNMKDAFGRREGEDTVTLLGVEPGVHIAVLCADCENDVKTEICNAITDFLNNCEAYSKFKAVPFSVDCTLSVNKGTQARHSIQPAIEERSKSERSKTNGKYYYIASEDLSAQKIENLGKIFFVPYRCIEELEKKGETVTGFCRDCGDGRSWRYHAVGVKGELEDEPIDESEKKAIQVCYFSEKKLNKLGPLVAQGEKSNPTILIILFLPYEQRQFFDSKFCFPAELEIVLECISEGKYYDVIEAEKAELKTENAELKTENAELKTENAELKTENATLTTENTTLKTALEMIQKKEENMKSRDDKFSDENRYEKNRDEIEKTR